MILVTANVLVTLEKKREDNIRNVLKICQRASSGITFSNKWGLAAISVCYKSKDFLNGKEKMEKSEKHHCLSALSAKDVKITFLQYKPRVISIGE